MEAYKYYEIKFHILHIRLKKYVIENINVYLQNINFNYTFFNEIINTTLNT